MKKQFKRYTKIKVWLLMPLGLNILIYLGALRLGDHLIAKSCLIGGLVAILPQALFGFYCFRDSGALKSKIIWRNFSRGEALKFILTGILFALVYKFILINALWFLLAYIIMQILGFLLNCRLLNY